ncbi:MAG TPA: hypothetical protein VK797_02160 [Tepidisphaeraceae bacterium]|nr:hypothetical protein [Tepidisphaeraceae bacterium]
MTAVQTANPLEAFQWTPQPRAEALVIGLLEPFLKQDPFVAELARRLKAEGGVRLVDMIDAFRLPDTEDVRKFEDAGYVFRPIPDLPNRYVHEGGIFPPIVLVCNSARLLYLKVESVVDFLMAWQTPLPTYAGWPMGAVRKEGVSKSAAGVVFIVERHGHRGFASELSLPQADLALNVLKHSERFRLRRRLFEDPSDGFGAADELIDEAIKDLGRDRACDLFFAAEREYWQRRNRAAQVQKARQDKLGIGWANHDHHTYRSSRENFARMIGVFEKLGFHCRERFYAGHQAGWGAQVLEQPNAGVVIFADVDLSPDELMGDFSHDGLAPRDSLGTVGLWCALHGEAFLEAGMHHLECQFDFEALKRQLEEQENVKVMKPFTDFPYLRQAFTEGEIWPVRPKRIDRLLKEGRITVEQARQFREHGALGSHLENLERNQGFKGFNQTGVSEIIARTDPRAHAAQH